MKSILFGVVVLLLSNKAFSDTTYPLLKIFNATNNETSQMDLIEDDNGEAQSLRQELLTKPGKIKTFDLKKITSGIVLQEQKGYNIVTLKGENIDYERGGDLKMEFLVNAITDTKMGKNFKIQKDPDGWKMYHRGQAIRIMKFIGNKKPIIGLVGVKEIKIQYEGEKDHYTEAFADDTEDRNRDYAENEDVVDPEIRGDSVTESI